MPRLPKEVFAKQVFNNQIKILNKNFKNLKEWFFIYSFVGIVIIEFLSLVLSYSSNYLTFWYPLLSQVIILVLLLTFLFKSKVLRFCKRKRIAISVLSGYYIFNLISLIFNIGDYSYSVVVNVAIPLVCMFLFISSVIKVK